MILIQAHCDGCMTAKLDEIASMVEALEYCPRNPHSDIIITAIVCGTILAIAWVALHILRRMRKDTMLHEKDMESRKRAWEEEAIVRTTLEAYRQKKLTALENGKAPDAPYVAELNKNIETLEQYLNK